MAMAGLCGTDYRIWSGDRPVAYPRVMGHELIGLVDALGPDVTSPAVGSRVAIVPNYSCGACALCREGNWNLCASRVAVGIDADGGFADVLTVPASRCRLLPATLVDDRAVVAEPLAVVVRAVDRGAPRAGQRAGVVGLGTLGLLAVQVLRERGLEVLGVSRSTRRFDLARELGASAVARAGADDLSVAARALSGREGLDLVVETAGTPEAVEHALAVVRPGGRVVLTGLPHERSTVDWFDVVRREVTLLGSMIYQDEFDEALRLLETGAVRTGSLVTHRFALSDIAGAFAAHAEPSSIKVVLDIGGSR
jgi:2-desacetyl-2-hydroxyethyl bacteriochlorophyllide A dehydrogenase